MTQHGIAEHGATRNSGMSVHNHNTELRVAECTDHTMLSTCRPPANLTKQASPLRGISICNHRCIPSIHCPYLLYPPAVQVRSAAPTAAPSWPRASRPGPLPQQEPSPAPTPNSALLLHAVTSCRTHTPSPVPIPQHPRPLSPPQMHPPPPGPFTARTFGPLLPHRLIGLLPPLHQAGHEPHSLGHYNSRSPALHQPQPSRAFSFCHLLPHPPTPAHRNPSPSSPPQMHPPPTHTARTFRLLLLYWHVRLVPSSHVPCCPHEMPHPPRYHRCTPLRPKTLLAPSVPSCRTGSLGCSLRCTKLATSLTPCATTTAGAQPCTNLNPSSSTAWLTPSGDCRTAELLLPLLLPGDCAAAAVVGTDTLLLSLSVPPALLVLLVLTGGVALGALIRGAVRAAISKMVVRVGAARWQRQAIIACRVQCIVRQKCGHAVSSPYPTAAPTVR